MSGPVFAATTERDKRNTPGKRSSFEKVRTGEEHKRKKACVYPLLSVSLTYLVVSLPPPRFSFSLVFFDIMITTIDIRHLIACVD
jgi:hypothetical protein